MLIKTIILLITISYASATLWLLGLGKYGAIPFLGKPAHNKPLGGYKGAYSYAKNYPNYGFEYSVKDPHTGDIKSHKEVRQGHTVKGVYSLVEPGGAIRTVNYVAGGHGFNAHVHRQHPTKHH